MAEQAGPRSKRARLEAAIPAEHSVLWAAAVEKLKKPEVIGADVKALVKAVVVNASLPLRLTGVLLLGAARMVLRKLEFLQADVQDAVAASRLAGAPAPRAVVDEVTLDLPAPGSDFLAAPFAPLDEEADAGEGDDVLPEPAAAGHRGRGEAAPIAATPAKHTAPRPAITLLAAADGASPADAEAPLPDAFGALSPVPDAFGAGPAGPAGPGAEAGTPGSVDVLRGGSAPGSEMRLPTPEELRGGTPGAAPGPEPDTLAGSLGVEDVQPLDLSVELEGADPILLPRLGEGLDELDELGGLPDAGALAAIPTARTRKRCVDNGALARKRKPVPAAEPALARPDSSAPPPLPWARLWEPEADGEAPAPEEQVLDVDLDVPVFADDLGALSPVIPELRDEAKDEVCAAFAAWGNACFRDLPVSTRASAARAFVSMLELAADGKLALSQDEPFGDIHVAAHVGGP